MSENELDLSFMEGVRSAKVITPLDQLTLAIVGPPKGGKSRLAATGRKPVWIADFDNRASSVSGLDGVFVKTYFDANPLDGKAFSDFQADLGKLEYQKLMGNTYLPKTGVVDSMTYFSSAAMKYVMAQSSKGVQQFNIGGFRVNVARGFDPYVGEMAFVQNTIERMVALGMDVIFVFHERPEETPDSTQENPKFTGKVTVHPPRAAQYLALFNELWRVKFDGSAYKVQVKPNYDFDAATCFSGLQDIEDPNIEQMIQKHLMAYQQK